MNRVRPRTRPGRRGRYLIAGAIACCLAVGLLSPQRQSSQKTPLVPLFSSSNEYVLKLNGAIATPSAGVIVALADRLFERNELSVRLVHGTRDADAVASVVADDHVIGLASAAACLKAREGSPVVAFAASYIVSWVEFLTLSNIWLLAPSDLEGKRIGYRPSLELSKLLQAFIAQNAVAQSSLRIVENESLLNDLLDGRIDVLGGHQDIEGHALQSVTADHTSLSPDSFGTHAMGPVHFAHERAFFSSGAIEEVLIAIANRWNAAYSDYDRTIPLIARSIDDKSGLDLISHFMDMQRRLLRAFGGRFGELGRLRVLLAQLLQRRIIQQPVDFARADNYDNRTEAYRTEANAFTQIEP